MKKIGRFLLVLLVLVALAINIFFIVNVMTATVPKTLQELFALTLVLGALKGKLALLWCKYLALSGALIIIFRYLRRKVTKTLYIGIPRRREPIILCRGSTTSIPFLSGLHRKGNKFSNKCQEAT